jgi:hypothetical protein
MKILDSLQEATQKAQEFAQNKQLRAAVTTAETVLQDWHEKTQIWEKLWGKIIIGNLINNLEQQLIEWRKQVEEADKLVNQAQFLLKNDTGDPLETKNIISAIALYRRYSQMIVDERTPQFIVECQQILARRQKFQSLVKEAQTQTENLFFKKAIAIYKQAKKLYPTSSIQQAINDVQAQVYQEEIYEAACQKAQQAESENRLRGAISLLDSALLNFPRSDGFELLEKIKSNLQGRELFRQGLTAEKAGDFLKAKHFYENAKPLLANSLDCQIRLGLIAIKTQNWENALSYLQGLPEAQATYLRGFVLAQQGNLQSAYREWKEISTPIVTEQKEILKRISQHQRLLYIKNIEELVQAENWQEAQKASKEFLQKFATNILVESNLKEHIEPSLLVSIWQTYEWSNIAQQMKALWINNPQINTLHNWVVATYYATQIHPENLFDLIISLSTALANINTDPTLKNIPWLKNQDVDFTALSINLKRRLEAALDPLKNSHIEDYLNLRDHYRREIVALKFMGEPATSGIQVNDIFLTPGCYLHFLEQWPTIIVDKIHYSQHNHNILRSLYTAWGLAVAACLEGDRQRAIKIKPTTETSTEIEKFAQNFVAYHEGCYHLQQQQWCLAIKPLQSVKLEIQYHQDWQEEIDRLCKLQRQVILEFSEHLEFANFWYEILPSSTDVKSYVAEYKAEEIRQQLVHNKITFNQALEQLQELQKIDSNNPIVMEMIENVELSQEIKEINRLFQLRQYEAMLKKAKLSQRDRVRYIVAEFFLETLMKGLQEGRLHDQKLILQLGSWAYEICPHEPAFQAIYQSLKLC